jgi:alkylhydroperoxidase family enzyme
MSRHQVHVDALRRSVLDGEGETPRELRRAAAGQGGEVPAELRAWVHAVRERAYAIEDADVAALKAGGWSEDEIFEVTVATALGAALHRLDAALAAIDAAKP